MEFKLNIYSKEKESNGKRKIQKEYKIDSYDLLYGTVEDILNLFDVTDLNNEDELFKLIKNAKNQVNDLLKDIFVGLTDEELKMTKFDEAAIVIVSVLKESIKDIVTKSKNAMRV